MNMSNRDLVTKAIGRSEMSWGLIFEKVNYRVTRQELNNLLRSKIDFVHVRTENKVRFFKVHPRKLLNLNKR